MSALGFDYDWKNPDYSAVWKHRIQNLRKLRAVPERWDELKAYYASGPDGVCDLITDWGVTFDPRNADIGLPTTIPFILFPRQREFVHWLFDRWQNRRPGLCEKSRDMGVTWLCAATACSVCVTRDGVAVGFGSRVVDLVDKVNTMKPILPKARMFMEYLPEELRAGYVSWRDAPYMRLNFPETGSIIGGEGGDQIGRGDRASFYLVDEKAYCANQESIDHALSQTTNCQIDVSSVRGMNNHFAKKRHEGRVDVFVFDWREDPRKDDAWYEKMRQDLDPVTVAQEIDRDYTASLENIVIPGRWVISSFNACEKLGINPTGDRSLFLDVADGGADLNAAIAGTGVEIDFAQEWTGKGVDNDIFQSVQKTFGICDEQGIRRFRYDQDGLGAGVRGDARVINEARLEQGKPMLQADPYRGSGKVWRAEKQWDDDSPDSKGMTNEQLFANAKAQAWWLLRRRFLKTHRWIEEGVECDPDEIISLNIKKIGPLYKKLQLELAQATFQPNKVGKIVIDKKPKNVKSPNLADALVGRFAPITAGMIISEEMLKAAAIPPAARRRR